MKDGKGMVSTESGVLKQTPYSFSTRFEGQPGTNPEELIATAHADCFSMALAAELVKVNLTPETIRTTAAVTMEKLESGWIVTESHLDVIVKMPHADKSTFETAANAAKALYVCLPRIDSFGVSLAVRAWPRKLPAQPEGRVPRVPNQKSPLKSQGLV
jgi:osmotically inducible protein OsmC